MTKVIIFTSLRSKSWIAFFLFFLLVFISPTSVLNAIPNTRNLNKFSGQFRDSSVFLEYLSEHTYSKLLKTVRKPAKPNMPSAPARKNSKKKIATGKRTPKKRIHNLYRRRIRRKLEELRAQFSVSKQAQTAFLQSSPGTLNRSRTRLYWKNSLKELQDRASELHGMLARTFKQIKRKFDFKLSITGEHSETGFKKEMRYISQEIDAAEQQIVDSVVHPTNTVSLSALQENMLIRLDRIRKMADWLSQKL